LQLQLLLSSMWECSAERSNEIQRMCGRF
jgi:hypothetical protein